MLSVSFEHICSENATFSLQVMALKAGALISRLPAMSQVGKIYLLPIAFWLCCNMAKYKSPSICFHKFNLEQIVSAASFYQPQLLFAHYLGGSASCRHSPY